MPAIVSARSRVWSKSRSSLSMPSLSYVFGRLKNWSLPFPTSFAFKTPKRIRTVAPFRRLLSSVDDFERVVPAAGAHPDEHPEGDRGLEPPRGLDPPEVEGPGPAELLHDADDGLLRRGVISADHQVGGPSRELGIDHLGIRHRVEGLDHPGAGEGPLDPLSEGIRHPDERDEVRVVRQRIRHVDHDLPVEAGVARGLEALLDRRAEGREDDDLPVLGRFFEGPRRGLPLSLHRPEPLRQALALRIPRADHHLVAAGREAASEGLPNIAAPQDADFHGRAKGSALFPDLDLSGRPRHGPMAQGPVVTYLSSARGRRGPWSRSSRWPWTTCTSSGPSSPPRRPGKEARTGSRPARP